MQYSAMELRAERSILRAMGLAAVFKTYGGEVSTLHVLPADNFTDIKSGDFNSRDRDTFFEALAADLPTDWRDGTIEVNGRVYNVLDVTLDPYQQRANIKAE
jgi:hypothetical protein